MSATVRIFDLPRLSGTCAVLHGALLFACLLIPPRADCQPFRGTIFRIRGSTPAPPLPDTDGDGVPDVWELANGMNPDDGSDALIDVDGDGMSALAEYLRDSDPWLMDSDGDGVVDAADPNVNDGPSDTDGDGLPDDWERHMAGTLDMQAQTDSDGDGLSNRDEWLAGSHPFVLAATGAAITGMMQVERPAN